MAAALAGGYRGRPPHLQEPRQNLIRAACRAGRRHGDPSKSHTTELNTLTVVTLVLAPRGPWLRLRHPPVSLVTSARRMPPHKTPDFRWGKSSGTFSTCRGRHFLQPFSRGISCRPFGPNARAGRGPAANGRPDARFPPAHSMAGFGPVTLNQRNRLFDKDLRRALSPGPGRADPVAEHAARPRPTGAGRAGLPRDVSRTQILLASLI